MSPIEMNWGCFILGKEGGAERVHAMDDPHPGGDKDQEREGAPGDRFLPNLREGSRPASHVNEPDRARNDEEQTDGNFIDHDTNSAPGVHSVGRGGSPR